MSKRFGETKQEIIEHRLNMFIVHLNIIHSNKVFYSDEYETNYRVMYQYIGHNEFSPRELYCMVSIKKGFIYGPRTIDTWTKSGKIIERRFSMFNTPFEHITSKLETGKVDTRRLEQC